MLRTAVNMKRSLQRKHKIQLPYNPHIFSADVHVLFFSFALIMDNLYVVLVSLLTINNAHTEKYCTSDFTLYIFTQYLIYNVKIHESTAKKKRIE